MFIKKSNHESSACFMQIRHDLKIGVLSSWLKFVPVLLIFAASCLYLKNNMHSLMIAGHLPNSSVSFADYILYTFRGMQKYSVDPENIKQGFYIPALWLLLNLYLGYIIGNYPLKDLHGYGQQILIRSKARTQWWVGKVIWNIVCVLAFYAVGYLTVIVITLATGTLSLTPSAAVALYCGGMDISGWTGNGGIIVAMIQPVISSLALCLIQMVLSFFIKSVFSYIVTIIILVLSAFYCSEFLIGNYSMMLRSNLILKGGVEFHFAVLFGCLLMAASIVIGLLRFKRMDILEKE